MKKISYISLAMAMSFILTACSSSEADKSHSHHEEIYYAEKVNHEGPLVNDLQTVDFMDEDFDMDKVEKLSCCDK